LEDCPRYVEGHPDGLKIDRNQGVDFDNDTKAPLRILYRFACYSMYIFAMVGALWTALSRAAMVVRPPAIGI
jgi:hypothetical protein